MPPPPASSDADTVPERATLGGDTRSDLEQVVLGILIVVPFLAVAAAVPAAWGGWLGWSDVVIFLVAYAVTGHGITVGFHRLLTHKSFKPSRVVKVLLAVAGSRAIQGPVVRWVADHRKHHKFSDRDIVRISRQFPLWVVVSLTAPAVAGGLVTWSINSICHTLGERPFVSRDKSANVWWLAIPSMGESWHNLHHADPTCARHGVLRGQVDTSARVIRWLEQLGWVQDVRWPVQERIDAKLVRNQGDTPVAA